MATYDKTAIGKYATPFDQNVANTNAVYNAGINSVNAQNTVQANQYQNARNNATKTLEGANANAYATYQKSIGQNANSSYGSNVSNYLKNASYGTYLNGLGTNQQTYNSAINNANTSWNDWLSSKASQEAELENTRQTTNDSWYQYYMDKVNTDAQLAEQQRQFDLQMAEDQRQFNETMAYNTSKSSSSSSKSKNPDGTEITDDTNKGDTRKIWLGTNNYITQTYDGTKWQTTSKPSYTQEKWDSSLQKKSSKSGSKK